jgi:hypothetical protein
VAQNALNDISFNENDTDYVQKLSDLAEYVQTHATEIALAVSGLSPQGGHDASGGSYPGSPSANQSWIITVAGTLGGDPLSPGDVIIYTGSGWVHRKVIPANLEQDTSPQLGGVLDPNGHAYNDQYNSLSSSGGTTTIDCATGNAFSTTLTENTTLAFSNVPASGKAYFGVIEIIQDASASGFTFSFPAGADWAAATAVTLTSTASAKDVLGFFTRDGGTTWNFFTLGQGLG